MSKEIFNRYQKKEIEEGLKHHLNVSVFAKPDLLAIQMHQIRLGLQDHLPMEPYANPEYDWFQLEEIRLGLKNGIDVKKYDSPKMSYDVMRQIRLGLEKGIDLSVGAHLNAGVLRQFRIALCDHVDIVKYIQEGYDEEQLIPIREAIQNGIDIAPYITPTTRGSAIREIVDGLKCGLDVSIYASDELSWQQMREIRIGLEEGLDVYEYSNSLYSWGQMQEIRLGLEENLDIDEYKSLMYTSKEMHKKRLKLLAEQSNQMVCEPAAAEYEGFVLMISEDWMDASVLLTDDKGTYKKDSIAEALKEHGVTTGIDWQAIEEIEENYEPGAIVTVARGEQPQKGADGWYEFLFDTDIKKKHAVLENGAIDYKNIKLFELVKKGQKVAYYHNAQKGEKGKRINGAVIPGLKGEELRAIEGRGIVRLKDGKTYASLMDGKVELIDGKIIVSNMLVLNDVTRLDGNIDFKGTVYIRGNIQNGVVIKAEKDIIVEGFIESARLDADGDIILINGNNAGGNGFIRAHRDVMGCFFENTHVEAGQDIKANYCLNSDMKAGNKIEISGYHGSIAGGRYEAGNSIIAHDIGNDMGLATYIKVGKKEEYNEDKALLGKRKLQIQKELQLLNNAYNDLQRKIKSELRNADSTYLKLEDAIYTKNMELDAVQKEMQTLDEESKKVSTSNVCVSGTLYSGVQVNIDGTNWKAETVHNVTVKKGRTRISLIKN